MLNYMIRGNVDEEKYKKIKLNKCLCKKRNKK